MKDGSWSPFRATTGLVTGTTPASSRASARRLVGRAGVGEAKIGGDLVGRGVHPPTLQYAELDNDSYGYEDTEDGDNSEHLL